MAIYFYFIPVRHFVMWVCNFVMLMLYLVMSFFVVFFCFVFCCCFLCRYADKSFDNIRYSDTGG